MPKYLFEASYTAEGVRGLLQEGGSKRRANLENTLKPMGAKLEVFYYALGDHDVYCIVDAPDSVSAAAVSMAVNASGAVRIKTTQLLTTEEIDVATKKSVAYRPPGK